MRSASAKRNRASMTLREQDESTGSTSGSSELPPPSSRSLADGGAGGGGDGAGDGVVLDEHHEDSDSSSSEEPRRKRQRRGDSGAVGDEGAGGAKYKQRVRWRANDLIILLHVFSSLDVAFMSKNKHVPRDKQDQIIVRLRAGLKQVNESRDRHLAIDALPFAAAVHKWRQLIALHARFKDQLLAHGAVAGLTIENIYAMTVKKPHRGVPLDAALYIALFIHEMQTGLIPPLPLRASHEAGVKTVEELFHGIRSQLHHALPAADAPKPPHIGVAVVPPPLPLPLLQAPPVAGAHKSDAGGDEPEPHVPHHALQALLAECENRIVARLEARLAQLEQFIVNVHMQRQIGEGDEAECASD